MLPRLAPDWFVRMKGIMLSLTFKVRCNWTRLTSRFKTTWFEQLCHRSLPLPVHKTNSYRSLCQNVTAAEKWIETCLDSNRTIASIEILLGPRRQFALLAWKLLESWSTIVALCSCYPFENAIRVDKIQTMKFMEVGWKVASHIRDLGFESRLAQVLSHLHFCR